MKFSSFIGLALALVLSSSLLVACNSNTKDTSSEKSTKVVDFSNNKNQKYLNSKLAKNFGLKDVNSIEIMYMNFNEEYNGKQNSKKPTSNYLIFEKNMEFSNINIINHILSSLYDNRTENKEKPFEKIGNVDSDLKKIKEGKMHPLKGKIKEFAGYSVYPGMKIVVPDKFDSSVVLKDSSGKTVKIPFFMDSIGMYINYDNKDYTLSENSEHLFDNILKQENIDADLPEDVYNTAMKNNLNPSFISKSSLKLPNKFKEDVFGDGFNLYWENVNDILKTDSNTRNGLDNYRGKNVTLEKYYINEGKLYGLKKFNGLLKQKKDQSIKTELWLVAIRDENNKLIGEFLTSTNQPYIPNARIDGKTLYQITGKTYYQWLDNAFEESKELKKLASLSGENLVKEYYSMLNNHDINATHLYIPDVTSISGKVFKDIDTNTAHKTYVNNIDRAKLISISKMDNSDESKVQNSESYAVNVDFKFKEVITTENGVDTLIANVVKIGNNLGYRILEIGH